jgi:pentatricopeptide repeat protein
MREFDSGLLMAQRLLRVIQSDCKMEEEDFWVVFTQQIMFHCLFKAGRISEADLIMRQLSEKIHRVNRHNTEIYELLTYQLNILRVFAESQKDHDQLSALTKRIHEIFSYAWK